MNGGGPDLLPAKLFFAYGLGNNMYFPMRVGRGGALFRPAAAEAMFETMHRHRPTIFFGVPEPLRRHAPDPRAEKALRPVLAARLRVAGEALPKSSTSAGRALGVEILDGSAPPRSCTSSCRTGPPCPPRLHGLPVPGYEAPSWTTRGGRPARRDRQPARQGRLHHGVLLNQHRRPSHAVRIWIHTGESTTKTGTASTGTAGAGTTC